MNLDNLTVDQQWNLFGCACRCLIRLAKLQGLDISKEDFIAKFGAFFPPKQIGLTNTAEQIEMAKGLGLCRTAFSVRDLRMVRKLVDERRAQGVLVLTDRNRDGQGELFHVRLLLHHDDYRALLFSPCQSGADYEVPESWAQLEMEFVHFLVLL
jgi:hypothetical protein